MKNLFNFIILILILLVLILLGSIFFGDKNIQLYIDDSSNYNEALELSNKLTKKIFKSFPKEGINLEWDKYNWKKYPYDNQYTQFHERWHEDGY